MRSAFPVGLMRSWSFLLLLLLLHLLTPPTFADKTPCKVCRDLTKSFKEHFDKTVGQNFGGGNTAWEEKSLGTYATSEARLVELLEKTCGSKDYKCGSLLEDQEEYLEDWFFNRQDKTDLFEDLCVDHLERCCLQNRWGAQCEECPGGVENPCSGHGTCHSEGERSSPSKHHGTCTCDKGYTGTLCDECKNKFIKAGDTCEECSSVCEGQCVAPGPSGCTACVKGYELLDDIGCTDINECEREGCGDPLEECVNSEGSYECVCKTGYTRLAGKCQLEELYADEDEEDDNIAVKEGDSIADKSSDTTTNTTDDTDTFKDMTDKQKEDNVNQTDEDDNEDYTDVDDDISSDDNLVSSQKVIDDEL